MDNIKKMIKQAGVPPEFKIGATNWPDEKKVAHEVSQAIEVASKSSGANQKPGVPGDYVKQFAKIATNVWRLKKRIYDSEGNVIDAYDKLRRSIEGIEQSMESLHVEIKDHTGDIYDPGMPVNPQSFEPMAGVNRDMIKDTLLPTIYWNKQIVQQGEIIVGIPQGNKEIKANSNHEKEKTLGNADSLDSSKVEDKASDTDHNQKQ